MQWPCGRTDAFGFNPYTIVGNSALAALQGRSGAYKATFSGETWSAKSAKPNGYSVGGAYSLPIITGGMSSHQSRVVFSSNGNAAQGVNIAASSDIIFASSGSAAAIASAAGSGSVTFSASGTAVAPLSASGSATASFSATGSISGIASITAASSFSLSASGETGAKGWMIAVPIDQSLSPVTIAEAVWASTAITNNDAGTMGELLNNSGASANPWTVTLEGSYTAADLVRIMASVLAGKVSGAGSGTETFRSIDDNRNAVVSVVDESGNRTSITLDPS